jgi:tripartite-type tricarboxylate transporter receptor subunit TctC
LRSYIAPPGTTPANLAVLRAAFDKTMADPAFLEDAKKMRVEIEALPGTKVEEVIRNLYASPKPVVERARRVIRQ